MSSIFTIFAPPSKLAYNSKYMKYVLALIVVLMLLAGGAFYFLNDHMSFTQSTTDNGMAADETAQQPDAAASSTEEVAEAEATQRSERPAEAVIGTSVEGRNIVAYHFGTGAKEVLFVGGIHGGYSWNTSLLAYELIDYLKTNTSSLPEGVSVTVIPTLNPDGLYKVTNTAGSFIASSVSATDAERIAARFNANDVDLNRNFDCEWAATSSWRSQTVSGGSAAFSEPEAQALQNYVNTYKPAAAVVWFAAEGKVYPSACGGTPSQASISLAATYAGAASYGTQTEFDAYAINGDAVNWLAKEGVPAISVLLSNYSDPEWSKNKAGILAVINSVAK